jgi:hypothetical protein
MSVGLELLSLTLKVLPNGMVVVQEEKGCPGHLGDFNDNTVDVDQQRLEIWKDI